MTKEMQQTFLKDLFETPLFVGAAIQESIVVSPILIFKSNLKIKIRNRDKQMMNRSYDKLPIRSYDKRGVYRCADETEGCLALCTALVMVIDDSTYMGVTCPHRRDRVLPQPSVGTEKLAP
jgi:hypothetical protein